MRRIQIALFLSSLLVLSACGEKPAITNQEDTNSVLFGMRSGENILPNWATDQERAIQQRALAPTVGPERAVPPAGFVLPPEYAPTRAVVMTYAGYTTLLNQIAAQAAAAGAEVWAIDGPDSISGVPSNMYHRLSFSYDSVWSRDYGPVGINQATGELGVVDPTYRHYASRPNDDAIPCQVANYAGASCYSNSLIIDGGNIMTDGHGSLFMSRRTYAWNSSLSEAEVDQALRDNLGVTTIHKFDYAVSGGLPADGTGHIDMFAKLLGECTVLVCETDQAPFAEPLAAAADYFANLQCATGEYYQVERLPGWYSSGTWYTYTNSLIINDYVLVPSYASGDNALAQQVYEQAMPGYTIVLLDSDGPITSGGTIHCLAKEIPADAQTDNQTPNANAGADQSVQSAAQVTLNGSNSSDPDGDSLTYAWTQTSGPSVSLSDSSAVAPTFTAPSVESATSLVFNLVVSDGQASDSDSVTVTVNPASGWNIDLGATDTPISIPDNNSTGITSTISVDSSGAINAMEVDVDITHTYIGDLRVVLRCPSGTTATLHDRSGDSDNNIHETYSVTACDGESVTGTYALQVTDLASYDTGTLDNFHLRIQTGELPNQPPVANAGVDQNVPVSASVTLDGTGSSDLEGASLTYTWTQTAGPTVTLSDAHVAQPTFTAPSSDCSLTFSLTVSDGELSSTPDTVNISVGSPVGHYYAVLAGVSDYKAVNDLSYCDEDASDWYDYLIAKDYDIQVFGDSHTSNYPQYDGLATESNIRQAIRDLADIATADDTVVIALSGHGFGNGVGSSLYCAWDMSSGENNQDGSYYDTEMASDLAGIQAKAVFVFFDSCYSGGMGPELAALDISGAVNVSTTCTENGFGYDEPSYQNGAWTHWYLEDALIDHFDEQNVDLHTVFPYAEDRYGATGGDAPMQFDNYPSTPFYLGPASSTAASDLASPSDETSPFSLVSLADMLESAARVEVMRTDWSQGGNPLALAQRAQLNKQDKLDAILGGIEANQVLLSRASRCLFSYSMTFSDASGAPLGEIGICQSSSYGENQDAVFVLTDEESGELVRLGLVVPDAVELVDYLNAQLN